MKKSNSRKLDMNKPQNNKKKAKIIILGVTLSIIIFLSAYGLIAKKVVAKWNDKVYPGITIENIDIGGMSRQEAESKLNEGLKEQIENKTITIDVENKEFKLKYSDIDPVYDVNGAVENAINHYKKENIFSQYSAIKRAEMQEFPINFNYDEKKLKEFEEKVVSEVNCEPKNATLTINQGNITIQNEEDGKTINEENLDKQLKEALTTNTNTVIKLELEKEQAKIKASDLSKIKGPMGTYSTGYGTSSPGRCTNIELATKSVNGTILMPGETFSFNDVVGDRSIERGYQEAGTYVGNKVEPGIGGGICQVSSTLYRAVMRSNIRSVERTNHSMVVGYMEPGLDATVSYGYLDYKFKNTYDFPIYIEGITAGKVITYTIYGDPAVLNGKTYEMTNEIVETYPPEVKEVEDATLPEGEKVKEGGAMTGYKVNSYQITYENGVEVNRELVATDTYIKVDSIVRIGTMKDETKQQEEEDNATQNEEETPDVGVLMDESQI